MRGPEPGNRTGARRAAVVLTALAALAPAAVATAPAVAKTKKKAPAVVTRSATGSATANGAIATATAVCPKKMRALGGGYSATPNNPALPFFSLVYESQKAGQNSWKASAQQFSASPQVTTITSFVYCRKGAPKTSTASATVTDPGTAQHFGPPAVASCTGKKKAMAGGFAISPPLAPAGIMNAVTDSFRASAKSWQVDAFHNTLGAHTLVAQAYCAEGKVPAAVTVLGPTVTAGGTPSTVVAPCAGKKSPVMGGFVMPAKSSTSLFIGYESERVGNGWQVTGTKNGSLPVALGSIAYCG